MIALLIPAGLFHGSVDSCQVGRPLDDLEWPHTGLPSTRLSGEAGPSRKLAQVYTHNKGKVS